MYETQRTIFERLNQPVVQYPGINPSAPTAEAYKQPETANWEREDALDYRNYFSARNDGKSHEEAVEYCNKQRTRR